MKLRAMFALLLLAWVCGATTVVPMSVEEMTRAAQDVVRVRVLESWSAWNPPRTLIYTYSRVQVIKALKGAAADTLVVKQLGGSADGYTQKVSGVRSFQAGEEALLFLRPSEAADGTMVVVGLMQGNFRVAQTASGQFVVSNGIPAVRTAADGRVLSTGSAVMTLDEITLRIRGAQQ